MRARIGPFEFEIDGDDATLDRLARPFEHYWVESTAPKPFRFWARRAEPSALAPAEGGLHIQEPTFALTYLPGRARLHYREQAPGAPEVPLNVGFMHALSLHAIDHDALLTHAAAVRSNGRGLVFVGRSGAGKSTLASWFPPEDILNDDYVLLIRTSDGKRTVSSQPLFGSSMLDRVGRPLSIEVEALYCLSHAKQPRVQPLSAGKALPVLMASVAVPSSATGHQERAFRQASDWALGPWHHLAFPLHAEQTIASLP